MNSKRGFTLIELLVVVAIMSMLMAVGLPGFQSIIASSQLTSTANAMVSALQLARSEALKQQKPVVVVKNTDWTKGWTVFVDDNSNTAQDVNEPTLAIFDALDSTITAPVGTGKGTYSNAVFYDASGRVSNNGHFAFCSTADFRNVVIAATGRVHVETPMSCS